MTTVSQAAAMIENLKTFSASALTAKVVGEFYAVFSYGDHFPVAIKRLGHQEPWLVNTDKKSPTTSRHQSVTQKAVGAYFIPSSTDNLRRLLGGGV